jgi:hypothetical protein
MDIEQIVDDRIEKKMMLYLEQWISDKERKNQLDEN